jgi:murein DD-endopeptidase MepM/ murein hydrolase activator NlpD
MGAGWYGAPRGARSHNGIDYAVEPGIEILSPVEGKVTKLGYPYADDLSFRYVQVTDEDGYQHRVFYVEPSVNVGQRVGTRTVIGTAQNIAGRYAFEGRMTNHVHYEVKDPAGNFVDPEGKR